MKLETRNVTLMTHHRRYFYYPDYNDINKIPTRYNQKREKFMKLNFKGSPSQNMTLRDVIFHFDITLSRCRSMLERDGSDIDFKNEIDSPPNYPLR